MTSVVCDDACVKAREPSVFSGAFSSFSSVHKMRSRLEIRSFQQLRINAYTQQKRTCAVLASCLRKALGVVVFLLGWVHVWSFVLCSVEGASV